MAVELTEAGDAAAAGVQARGTPWPRVGLLLLALVGALSLLGVYDFAEDRSDAALTRDARVKAQLQVAVLQSELDKQRSAPVILADDSDVKNTLVDPSPAQAVKISQKLAKLQAETKSAAIYLIDRTGRTLSSSNYTLPSSFVGSNYAFRRYFADALRSGQAEQFALGTVSLRPGLYIAHRVESRGRPVGVVVVKVEFDPIEAAWARAGTTTFVTDARGDILLTSNPDLRFRKTPPATPAQLVTSVPAPAPGWTLQLLTPREPALRAARSTTAMAAMAVALVMALFTWLWRRRKLVEERAAAEAQYREKLERNVALRTQELRETNARLSDEIRERQLTEGRLNVLQADLVQANKLAQLGQITAGVAHEINQPLATIRVLAENCLALLRRPRTKPSSDLILENLGNVVRYSERIGHITGELRTFSRKATGENRPVPLKQTLDSSILLNRSRLRDNRVRLTRETIDPHLQVIGGRVRLEQVVVNLLQNACEALESTPDPQVRMAVAVDEDWVWLRISDNGPGVDPAVMAKLFTPFVTTKESGLGLGLVIAHDILRDFGGDLIAETPPQGAAFTLKLRRAAS